MPGAWRILIADDHPLMRAALRQAVVQSFAGCELVEAGTLETAVAAVRAAPPERPFGLVLLDLMMPGAQGFAGLFLFRAEFPGTPVIVVSASEGQATMRRAAAYGAAGFIPKSAPLGKIAEAIRTVLAGDLWFPALAPSTHPESPGDDAAIAARIASLTPQQLRVLMMITGGMLNKQIAHELGIGEATVKAHVTVILRKLGVISRTQAVIAAAALLADAPRPTPHPSAS
jgi:DNA-binding NarL/FixJ family response regulator